VRSVEGSDAARERLRAILETVAGRLPIADAAARLGIGEARFHELRKQALQAAVAGLEGRRAGRPPKTEPANAVEVRALRAEGEDLRRQLEASRIREELARVLPRRGERRSKKNG
jgi:hypothetical protein